MTCEHEGTNSKPQSPHFQKPVMIVNVFRPSTGEMETDASLRLPGQPASMNVVNSRPGRDPVSRNKDVAEEQQPGVCSHVCTHLPIHICTHINI